MDSCLHFTPVYPQVLSPRVLSQPELQTQLPPVRAGGTIIHWECYKAGVNRSLFVASHEESPGMWDATSDIGWCQKYCLSEDLSV